MNLTLERAAELIILLCFFILAALIFAPFALRLGDVDVQDLPDMPQLESYGTDAIDDYPPSNP